MIIIINKNIKLHTSGDRHLYLVSEVVCAINGLEVTRFIEKDDKYKWKWNSKCLHVLFFCFKQRLKSADDVTKIKKAVYLPVFVPTRVP